MFGILAGVRSEMFEIKDNVGGGIPEETPKEIRCFLEVKDYNFHSFTWYTLENLADSLKWTAEKIDMYIKAKANIDPEFIAYGEIDEYKWLMHNVLVIVDKLMKVKAEHKDIDFKKSKVLFFFDS